MANNLYVNSVAGSNTSPFDTWAKGATTLAAAVSNAAATAGSSIWVASDHNEASGASITLTSQGTVAAPIFVYSVNRAGSVPPVSADLTTGAIVSPGAAGNFSITVNGAFYFQGIAFKTGSGANAPSINLANANPSWQYFKNCSMVRLGTTTSSLGMGLGGGGAGQVIFDNTTWQAGNVADTIACRSTEFVWKNTANAIAGATIPTSLFTGGLTSAGPLLCKGVDFSALGAGTIFPASIGPRRAVLQDCKLAASTVVAAAPAGPGNAETVAIRADSSGANSRQEKYQYMGTQTAETSIVRSGGASDGATPISWKIVTPVTGPLWTMPFESIPISFWNDSTSSMTVTVFGNGASVPNDDDLWVEIEYLGAAGSPVGSFVTTTKADNLAASGTTNNSSDTSSWAGGTTAFKVTSPSFTPAQKGPIQIVVKAAKANSTFYIDPKPIVAGVSTPKSYIVGPGVYVNELFGGIPASRLQLGA